MVQHAAARLLGLAGLACSILTILEIEQGIYIY